MRIFISLVFLLITLSIRADVSGIYGKFSPTGSASTAQPTISWKLTPTGGGKVTHVEMTLNERAVEADYNTQNGCAEYRPSDPLQAGLYSVQCRVTIDREVTLRQEWSFEVAGSDQSDAKKPSFGAGYALEETNAIRAALGLPYYVMDDRMNAAASAHSRYQILNRATGHVEEPGRPGYTGKAPWDRTEKFGFPDLCYEGVCGNQHDPRKAVRLLFDAPYHRIAFLQPGAPKIGIGFEAGAMTIDYAVSPQEGVGMSPSPNQAGIPLAWDGNESPSPLRVHRTYGATGYPIVYSWFSPTLENIKIGSMRLTGPDGKEVPSYVNTPNNDNELRFSGVILPKDKLQPATRYTVDVKATTERGQKIDRTWSFVTGS